ncbi:MAG: DUF5309 family protein, partial [Thermodesulfobacteriota bacterium]
GTYYRIGDTIKITRTGEQILVTAISTNTLTVVRGYDTTEAGTGVNIVDKDEVLIIGNALSERGAAPAARITATSTVTNYCQFFSRTLNLSEIRDHTEEYGTREKERQRQQQLFEFKRDCENAFKFGKPLADVEASSPLDSAVADSRYTTAGLLWWIDQYASANALDANGAISQSALWDFIGPMFQDMEEDVTGQGKSLMALCSQKSFKAFHQWAIARMEPNPGDKSYGLQLQKYMTPVGVLDLVQDYTLSGVEYGDYMIVINPSDLEYVYMNGMDMSVKPNVQQPDVHEIKDEFYGVIGLGIHRPELHGYVKNMAAGV